jgi:hypothetical protein
MITSQNSKQSGNITIGNDKFEVVQTFTYLGPLPIVILLIRKLLN